MVTEVFERLLESLANIYCAVYVLGRAKHCGHRWISIDFALQGFGSSSGPVGDAERTIPSTVSPLHTNLQAANFQRCKHAFRQRQVRVKLQPVLHLLLLMISQLYHLPPPLPPPGSTLLACSLGADLRMPAVASSVQLLSRVRLFVTPWTAACQVSLSITNSQTLLKLMSIESGHNLSDWTTATMLVRDVFT